jgi:tetratricopeptide (TPR) repeat protein
VALEGLDLEQNYPDLWFYKAKAHIALGEIEEALESYKNYLLYIEKQGQTKDLSIINYTSSVKDEAFVDMAVIYRSLNKAEEALVALGKVTSHQLFKKVTEQTIGIFFDIKDISVIKEFYSIIKKAENPEMANYFYLTMENHFIKGKGDFTEIYAFFAEENRPYGLLNKIRLIDTNIVDPSVVQALKELNFNEQDSYFGDIIYFIVKSKMPLDILNLIINEESIERLFQYLDAKYGGLLEIYLEYIQSHEASKTFEIARIFKIMARRVLFSNNVGDDQYKLLFNRYVDEGIVLLRGTYSQAFLEERKGHLLKNREDMFFLYMEAAKTNKQTHKKEYIKNLKEALKVLPDAKRGIELLIKEITDEIANEPVAPSSEMEAYAQKVKQNIRLLIDQGNYRDAELFIKTFDEILPEDKEIEKFKQEINNKKN